MKITSIFTSSILVVFIALSVNLDALWAMQDISELSGLDQRFTTEYGQERFAEQFHEKEVQYGSPIVDEKKLNPIDLWRYDKQIKFNAFHDRNFSGTYHDNKPETVYTYGGSFTLSQRKEHVFIKSGYSLSYNDYVKDEKASRFNLSNDNKLRFNFNRITITLDNNLKPDTAIAQGERTELKTVGDSKRVITWANNMKLNVDYKYSLKTDFSLDYINDLLYFPEVDNEAENNHSQSQMVHTVIPKITYKLTPKTNVFADYQYSRTNYFDGDTFSSHLNGVNVGINGRVFFNLGAELSIGYRYRQYDDTINPSDKGFDLRFGLSKKITHKLVASVSATREVGQDLDSAEFETRKFLKNFYGMNLTYTITPKISLGAEAEAGFTEREGAITMPDIENPSLLFTRLREDEIYKYSLKLNWLPRRFLNFLLAYEFYNKNSTFKDFEYCTHKFLGSVNYKF